MDNQQVQSIGAQLDTIIRLLAAPFIEGKSIAESAPVLSQLGMGNSEIAAICGTTPNVVRTALTRHAARRRR